LQRLYDGLPLSQLPIMLDGVLHFIMVGTDQPATWNDLPSEPTDMETVVQQQFKAAS